MAYLGKKEDYDAANRRRSAKGLMKKYSPEELKMMADIGDYLYQRIEMGASTGEVLTHLAENTRFCDFLRDNRKLGFYHFETAYLLQKDRIPGVSLNLYGQRNFALEKAAERSLDRQVELEDLRYRDAQDFEIPLTSDHTRSW